MIAAIGEEYIGYDDNITGHVNKLDLGRHQWGLEARKVDPCLLELEHLSYSQFGGRIPHQHGLRLVQRRIGIQSGIAHNTRTSSVCANIHEDHQFAGGTSVNDEIEDSYSQFLYVDDINWVSQLSSLQHLEMNHVDLGMAHNLFEIAETYKYLDVLVMRDNLLIGGIPSSLCQLFQSQVLNFANNTLSGSIPRCIGNLTAMLQPTPINLAISPGSWPSDIKWKYEGVNQVLKGIDRDYIKNLVYLANLDLSKNNHYKKLTRLLLPK
ncbi:Receptor-like protein EIX2 [Senna tora]|uniref:Receptor-like protein EIX2 n=1 Tax=Senna tora TaxID=362788 RepID=A0A834WII4_9FABA|nr:Receptor-like protein EIX2 [Senna tora]